MRALRSILILGAMSMAATASSAAQWTGAAGRGDETVREAFLKRVDAYVQLHRRLEANLPPEVITADPQALFVPRYALAREIRRARADARQGELFTPATAVYFKELVTRTLNESGIGDFLAIVEEENTVTLVPQVNGDYPAGASICFMPPSLLAALPPLP